MKDKRPMALVLGVLIAGALALVLVVALEVYFFKRYVRELVALKEDYENYRQGLRRIIAERQGEAAQGDGGDVKKKACLKSEQVFQPVNRDGVYLYNAAYTYVCEKGLEEQWYAHVHKPFPGKKKLAQSVPLRNSRIIRQAPRAPIADCDVLAVIKEHSFILPIDARLFRISSRFGPRRKRDGTWGFHYGLDLAAPYKTPVRAVAHGVIVEAGRAKGFGNTVVVSHSNKIKTRYAHLARYHVKVGDTVSQGQLIGLVGNTGNVRGRNGIHLHIEVLLYGKRIDPWYIFSELRHI